MDELCSYLGKSSHAWHEYVFTARSDLETTEVWERNRLDDEPTSLHAIHDVVSSHSLRDWLAGSTSRQMDCLSQGFACAVRVIWINAHVKKRSLDIASHEFRQVMDLLNHHELYESARSPSAAFSHTSESLSRPSRGYIGIHPKLAITWSRPSELQPTTIICIADPLKVCALTRMLEQRCVQRLARHGMIALLLVAILFSQEIDRDHEYIKTQVRKVEVRTGHHSWRSRTEAPAEDDLFHLSARMSGYRTKTASSMRKFKILLSLIDYVLMFPGQGARTRVQDRGQQQTMSDQTLHSYFELLKHRAVMQKIDAEFIESRVHTQLEALFHLIAQNDAMINHEVAKDSRMLALASQRDSSSMKSLAVVTMSFLPGTFVASVFSIPLIDFGSTTSLKNITQGEWKPRLLLYVAFTGPLMLLTFSLWGLWMLVDSNRRKRQNARVRQQLRTVASTTETGALARRWTSISMQSPHSDASAPVAQLDEA